MHTWFDAKLDQKILDGIKNTTHTIHKYTYVSKTSKKIESISSAGSHGKNEGKRQGPQIAYVAFRSLQTSQRTSKEIRFNIQSCRY